MKNKEVILIDMDGVIVDLMGQWLDYINCTFNESYTVSDCKSWDMRKNVDEKYHDYIWGMLDIQGFYKTPNPIADAVDTIKILNKDFNILIVTHQWTPTAYPEKYEWLERHLPFLDESQYIFTGAKEHIQGDYLIEDNLNNIAKWLDRNKNGTAIVFDQPYNRTITTKNTSQNNYMRMYKWSQILDYFKNKDKK